MDRQSAEVGAFHQQEMEGVGGYHWLGRSLYHFGITTLDFREYLGMEVWP